MLPILRVIQRGDPIAFQGIRMVEIKRRRRSAVAELEA